VYVVAPADKRHAVHEGGESRAHVTLLEGNERGRFYGTDNPSDSCARARTVPTHHLSTNVPVHRVVPLNGEIPCILADQREHELRAWQRAPRGHGVRDRVEIAGERGACKALAVRRRRKIMTIQLGDRNNLLPSASRPNRALLDGRYVLKFPLAYAASGTAWGALDTFNEGPRRVVVKFVKHLVNGDPNELVLLRARQASIPWKSVRALPLIEELGGFEASPFLVFGWDGGEALNPHLQSAPNGLRLSFPAVSELAKAVAALHGAGLLHLDLAPASVVYDTKTRALRLIDWGHALPVHYAASTYLARVASAAYAGIGMRPSGTPSMRDDVYSAACMIYELLSGHHPYGRRTATEAAFRHVVPAPIDRLSTRCNALLARALDPSQSQPAVMMAELVEGLARAECHAVARAKQASAAALSGGMQTIAVMRRTIAPAMAKPTPTPGKRTPQAPRHALGHIDPRPARPLEPNAAAPDPVITFAPIPVTQTSRDQASDLLTVRQRRPAHDGRSEHNFRSERRASTSIGLPLGVAITVASIAIGVVAAAWLARGGLSGDRHNAGVAIGSLSVSSQRAAGAAATRSVTLGLAPAQTPIDRR
jgi:serine/threonine protein kinase